MRNVVTKPSDSDTPVRHAILRLLNARVSLPSWMFALSACGISYIALYLLYFTPGGLEEFGKALPIDSYVWTVVTVIATTMTVLGLMFTKAPVLLRWGSFASFLAWLMGGFAFATSGQAITAVIVALPWIIFYIYAHLASYFRDETGI
jgi:hypothetical protein